MPLYEYECDACGQRFELIRKFSESDLEACAKCGKGPVRRLMSSPAIQFKGTGWYITDYASKGKSSADGSSSSSSKETKKADAGSSDASSKTESTGATTAAPKPSTES